MDKELALSKLNTLAKAMGYHIPCDLAAIKEETASGLLKIDFQHVGKDECYTRGIYDKPQAIVLHHTAGRHNPYKTINGWTGDNRGCIATHFVIGGIDAENGDDSYNGKIVRCMNDDQWAYHLGALGRKGNAVTQGIEINSAGGLKNKMTWFGTVVQSDQIVSLTKPFRGYSQFHRYSDEQLIAVKKLIIDQCNQHNIDVKEGLIKKLNKSSSVNSAFAFDKSITSDNVRGVIAHTNVKTGKSDVFPQQELVDMLLSI